MTELRPFRVEIGAADDARYITGQTLGVDGGFFLHA
jgi:NAD(P)-dependent dehydrogenase (short-subunit alcohol dehydrogenase family)